MNPQPANTYPASYPDARINQVLSALRTAEPPAGLEYRIAARLAQAAEARSLSPSRCLTPSPFAVILNAVKDPRILLAPARRHSLATAALTLLIALTTITLLHHRSSGTAALSQPATANANPPKAPVSETPGEVATTLAPRPFTATVHRPDQQTAVSIPAPPQPDLDQIALAETLAPSRPAPPRPLTQQEQLMAAATRPGQPIQLAELDLARAPFRRAEAEARRTANFQRYVKSVLAPFAIADALQPTELVEPREISTAAPAPQPSTSSTN